MQNAALKIFFSFQLVQKPLIFQHDPTLQQTGAKLQRVNMDVHG